MSLPLDARLLQVRLAAKCRGCGGFVDDGQWGAICHLHGLDPALDAGNRTCAKCIRTAREQRPKPRPAPPPHEPLGLRITRGGYEG